MGIDFLKVMGWFLPLGVIFSTLGIIKFNKTDTYIWLNASYTKTLKKNGDGEELQRTGI
ncbi:MAG: hypothetical protein ABJE29_15080 [Balneola sp.]